MNARKRKNRMDVFMTVIWLIVFMYLLSMIFILGFGLLNSLKYWVDFNTGNIFGLPSKEYGWRFDNYSQMMQSFYVQIKPLHQRPKEIYMLEMFLNALLFAVITSFFTIITQVMTAYGVAKYDFKLGKLIYAVAIIAMIIPIVGSLASQVRFAQVLGLNNSFIGVAIMNCKYPGVYFLVFYATFKSVPWTYAEAAQIDGAGHWSIFLKIMLPMIASSLFAVFILYFIQFWNDYYTPMIFLPNKPTISYGLYWYQSNTNTDMTIPIQLAASFATSLPIIILFCIFRNKIMGNVNVGGIKG